MQKTISVKKLGHFIEDVEVKFAPVKTLTGKTKLMPVKVGDGSIIKLFDKTPYPEKPTDVVCPHFLELKWANGCRFNCAWCYLQGTFRFRPMKNKPYLKDMNKTMAHLMAFFNKVKEPYILNSGELSDSLVFEYNGAALTQNIAPLFLQQNTHKLLIVTKSADVKKLLRLPSTKSIIASFSINAKNVAATWEKGAPPVEKRLEAARKLQEKGFELRLRIDPMVPVKNWREHYKQLLIDIFENYNLSPDRITLGSLRGLQSTINNAWDKSWVKYLEEKSNWGKRIKLGKRLAMYSFVKNYLESHYDYTNIALCKETIEVWNNLGMDYQKIRCNCVD
jgi:spore photoproduct lyase